MEESVESVGGGSLGSMATDLSYNLEKGEGERDRGGGGMEKMKLKIREGMADGRRERTVRGEGE